MTGAALWSLIGTATVAETISPASIYVIDGDTIDVDGNRFRLVGLDTPETYSAQCDYELALDRAATVVNGGAKTGHVAEQMLAT